MPRALGARKSLSAIGIISLGLVLSLTFFAHAALAAPSTSASTGDSDPSAACTGLGTAQEAGDCQGTGQFGDQTGPDTIAEVPEIEG